MLKRLAFYELQRPNGTCDDIAGAPRHSKFSNNVNTLDAVH